MKQNLQKVWVPDNDTSFRDVNYQYVTQQEAYKVCQSRRVALDCGAHVGFWSKNLVKEFETVHAFEPNHDNAECLRKNLGDKLYIYEVALGDHPGTCHMVEDSTINSGAWHAAPGGTIPVITLDSLDIPNVDFIKIDTQGSEAAILRGAINTITTWHPVLVVEHPEECLQWLLDLGYRVHEKVRKDTIFIY